jgi:hypothetical protein
MAMIGLDQSDAQLFAQRRLFARRQQGFDLFKAGW